MHSPDTGDSFPESCTSSSFLSFRADVCTYSVCWMEKPVYFRLSSGVTKSFRVFISSSGSSSPSPPLGGLIHQEVSRSTPLNLAVSHLAPLPCSVWALIPHNPLLRAAAFPSPVWFIWAANQTPFFTLTNLVNFGRPAAARPRASQWAGMVQPGRHCGFLQEKKTRENTRSGAFSLRGWVRWCVITVLRASITTTVCLSLYLSISL